MARTRSNNGFTALRIEGGILPPEFLQVVAGLEAPHQTASDYGLSRSLALKEELARYWRIAGDLHATFLERRSREDLSPHRVSVEEYLVPLLCDVLGYGDLDPCMAVEHGGRAFKLTHRALGGAVPCVLTHGRHELDHADQAFGEEGRRQAPHGLVQEYLNADDSCLWGFASNGTKLRLLRDNASMTRPAYIEADLDLMFADQLYSDFAALWLTAHATRLAPKEGKPTRCIVEGWRAEAIETGERVLGHLRDGVTQALIHLGNGFLSHPGNDDLRDMLKEGALNPESYFQQLLRLVYRMLFLFTAEERDLLLARDAAPQTRETYVHGYSITRLRERALRRRSYDRHSDLWQGLTITFTALGAGAPALAIPALGGLFNADQCPELDRSAIANEHLLEAIRSLAFFRTDTMLARVNYRDMGTEELGSVYESLLELQPVLDVQAEPWTFRFAGVGTTGSERKLTGSYYTPPPLVNELVRSALEPVLSNTVARHRENPRNAILDLRVVDPACGSGHFLLAAARRMAAEVARIDAAPHAPDEAVRQHALRDVVQHCIHGVDRNPLAVELCRTALWIETVEPGKPLTFLDSHIQLGDSLIGVLDPEILANGVPAAAYKPLTGDDKASCQILSKRNKDSHVAKQATLFDDGVLEIALTGSDLDAMPEDTLEDVERKSIAWRDSLQNDVRTREQLRAGLFTSAFFATKSADSAQRVAISADLQRLANANAAPPDSGVVAEARELAIRHRFFHWHLAFAEIMQNGGFDVVLGNPPWERIKLQEQEFFASRSDEITSAPNKAARGRLINALVGPDSSPADRTLFSDFQNAKRGSEAASQFVRSGGRFPLTGTGDVNTYAVFAETFLRLIGPRGRAGLILPTGIATDKTTKAFFDDVVANKRLASLYDFENREKVFPGIDSRIKFCLLTLSGSETPSQHAEFAFFLHQVDQLSETERRFTLSTEDFALFNPNTRTCPIFRTQRDMEIARKMYRRAGVFWRESRGSEPDENPWGARLETMFHMSNDSDLFRTREELIDQGWELDGNVFCRERERFLPLYEAKLFHQYDHRFATFDGVPAHERFKKNVKPPPMQPGEKARPDAVVQPRYWVPEAEVTKKLDKPDVSQTIFSEGPRDRGTEGPRDRSHSGSSLERRTSERRWPQYSQLAASTTRRPSSGSRLASNAEVDYECDQPKDTDDGLHSLRRARTQGSNRSCPHWLLPVRKTARSTDERTSIASIVARAGMSDRAPLLHFQRAEAACLMAANLNSIVLDYAARTAIGGTDLSYFIIKQLPVLNPEDFQEKFLADTTYADMIIPRVLELTYTAYALRPFANDLGYDGPPFAWDPERRHRVQCELDAIYAHIYRLDRDELEWILDAPSPSASFPTLKRNELALFGEYRTQRFVLAAYDQIIRGDVPDLTTLS